jgi:hypothetical protein
VVARIRGYHEVVHGVGGECSQGVDLFGYLHRAQLGSHGCAHSPRHHQPAQHRTELAAHGYTHHRQRGGVHADFVELEIGLRAEHHSGEGARDQHHRKGLNADEIDLVEQVACFPPAPDQGGQCLAAQESNLAESVQGVPQTGPKLCYHRLHVLSPGAREARSLAWMPSYDSR